MTKQDLLLKALREGRSVTHLTALADYKVGNLTAVLGDLRRAGHEIKCVRERDVLGQPYSKWVLAA